MAASCFQTPRTSSMLGPQTFKKPTVVRRFSSWLSHCISTAPSHKLPKPLTIPSRRLNASSNPTKGSAWSLTASAMTSSESYQNMHRVTQMTKARAPYGTNSSILICHRPESGLMNLSKASKPTGSAKSKYIATRMQTSTLCTMLSTKDPLQPQWRSIRMPEKADELSCSSFKQDMAILNIVIVPS